MNMKPATNDALDVRRDGNTVFLLEGRDDVYIELAGLADGSCDVSLVLEDAANSSTADYTFGGGWVGRIPVSHFREAAAAALLEDDGSGLASNDDGLRHLREEVVIAVGSLWDDGVEQLESDTEEARIDATIDAAESEGISYWIKYYPSDFYNQFDIIGARKANLDAAKEHYRRKVDDQRVRGQDADYEVLDADGLADVLRCDWLAGTDTWVGAPELSETTTERYLVEPFDSEQE